MIRINLPAFNNVVATGVATLKVPSYNLAINRIILTLGGGAFTKAMITDIKVKLGARTVYQTTGTRLDSINAYKGINTDATHLTIDFTERDAPDVKGKEVATYDLGVIRDDMYLEVTITGATTPTLAAAAMLTPTTKQPGNDKSGNPYIMKLVQSTYTIGGAGKFPILFAPRGALVKRLHVFHANMTAVEVKKSGVIVYEGTVSDLQFMQTEYRKVAVAGHFSVDFVVDNNQSGMLVTSDASALEFNPTFSAADTPTVVMELVDLPYNV